MQRPSEIGSAGMKTLPGIAYFR